MSHKVKYRELRLTNDKLFSCQLNAVLHQTPSEDTCDLTTVLGPERYRRELQQQTLSEHLEKRKNPDSQLFRDFKKRLSSSSDINATSTTTFQSVSCFSYPKTLTAIPCIAHLLFSHFSTFRQLAAILLSKKFRSLCQSKFDI